MTTEEPLSVVLCWHMHQPEYRDLQGGDIHLPWTYLHAIKDYVDMVAHVEALPTARAVVNFAPILLEQIEDYRDQLGQWLQGDADAIRDPLLAALATEALSADPEWRLRIERDCLRAHRERMIARFEPYRRLVEMADWFESNPDNRIHASDQFLADLLVWYHLAWMAESERRRDPRIARLQAKAQGFTTADRRELVQLIFEQLEGLLPRYRRLAESGQLELAMSPYAHPIVPLMLDLAVAREAMPEAPLPVAAGYPGGEARAHWHLEQGLATFQRVFGCRPRGIWPSEGGVSEAALALFAQHDFEWAASGGGVLGHSLGEEHPDCRHRVFRFGDAGIDCFFRDDGLSDLIGFRYADWQADDAVGDMLSHLENIAGHCPDRKNCLVSIILDGENAWEYYPENGFDFLQALYRGLAEHPRLRLTTFSDFRDQQQPQADHREQLVAGSWVYGTFSTWIGDQDKNRGWDLLVQAKSAFDDTVAAGGLAGEALQAAERQLAICEGSDWFWWFGDYNPAGAVADFDRLYRMQLGNLYRLLGLPLPAVLGDVISTGGGDPERGGVMRTGEPGAA